MLYDLSEKEENIQELLCQMPRSSLNPEINQDFDRRTANDANTPCQKIIWIYQFLEADHGAHPLENC